LKEPVSKTILDVAGPAVTAAGVDPASSVRVTPSDVIMEAPVTPVGNVIVLDPMTAPAVPITSVSLLSVTVVLESPMVKVVPSIFISVSEIEDAAGTELVRVGEAVLEPPDAAGRVVGASWLIVKVNHQSSEL
jgi:hypothetical protein